MKILGFCGIKEVEIDLWEVDSMATNCSLDWKSAPAISGLREILATVAGDLLV